VCLQLLEYLGRKHARFEYLLYHGFDTCVLNVTMSEGRSWLCRDKASAAILSLSGWYSIRSES
jgi:hypothetical protein